MRVNSIKLQVTAAEGLIPMDHGNKDETLQLIITSVYFCKEVHHVILCQQNRISGLR